MYVYQLTYRDEGNILPVGYFGSWKKARNVMKKFRSTLPGFKEYPNYFVLKKVKKQWLKIYFSSSCGIEAFVISLAIAYRSSASSSFV